MSDTREKMPRPFVVDLNRNPWEAVAPAPFPEIGDRFEWGTAGGQTYAGTVTEVDNGDVVVMCDDGKERTTTWE